MEEEFQVLDKKTQFGGFTLAQIEAKMNSVKAAYEADQLDTNSVLKAKWGLVRKAWNAGCTKCPITAHEMGAFAHAVLGFCDAVQALPVAMTSMTETEISGFREMVSSYYRQAIPCVNYDVTAKVVDDGQEAPGLGVGSDVPPEPEPSTASPAPAVTGTATADGEPLPDPSTLGKETPLGDGTPVIQTTPSAAPAPNIDIGGGSTEQSSPAKV